MRASPCCRGEYFLSHPHILLSSLLFRLSDTFLAVSSLIPFLFVISFVFLETTGDMHRAVDCSKVIVEVLTILHFPTKGERYSYWRITSCANEQSSAEIRKRMKWVLDLVWSSVLLYTISLLEQKGGWMFFYTSFQGTSPWQSLSV